MNKELAINAATQKDVYNFNNIADILSNLTLLKKSM